MRTQRISWLMLLLLLTLGLVLPAAAQDAAGEPLIEKDSLYGLWHAQYVEGKVFPVDDAPRIHFEEDGEVIKIMGDGGEMMEPARFIHDEAASTLMVLHPEGGGTQIAFMVKYSFLDDMLILRFDQGAWSQVMELTRNAEGTERHQRMRAEMDDRPSEQDRVDSAIHMVAMHQGLMSWANDHGGVRPGGLGELVVKEYVSETYLFTPWNQQWLPDDYHDWSDIQKIAWANEHSDYVFLQSGKQVVKNADGIAILDATIIEMFELPSSVEADTVTLLFEDNHYQIKPYDEADALIKQQTGHSIAQWMKTTTPGAGEMVQPEEDEENAARNAADDAGAE